jgi:hypothetical protein
MSFFLSIFFIYMNFNFQAYQGNILTKKVWIMNKKKFLGQSARPEDFWEYFQVMKKKTIFKSKPISLKGWKNAYTG